MFKYPSPWQVLCSSLEKREQVQSLEYGHNEETVTEDCKVSVNGEEGGSSLQESELSTDYRNDATDSAQTIVQISTQYQIIGLSDADSITVNLQKNTEDYQNSSKLTEFISQAQTERESERELDLHTTEIYADEEITGGQKPNTTNTEEKTSASDLTMDRVTRSLIFSLSSSKSIDDLTSSTPEETQVADKNKDVWIPPPDRDSKLKVLREEERFEIRSHRPETSPSKLFVDSDGEGNEKARASSHEFTPEKAWELEQERRDIIKKQSQRKSLDAEELIDLQGSTDSLYKKKEVNGVSGGQTTADIDMEQINFEAARQQFVMLEKKRNSLPKTPRLQHRSPRLSSQSLYESYSYSEFTKQKQPPILEQEVKAYKNEGVVTQETIGRERSTSLLRKQFLRDLSVDAVDSGEQANSREVYGGEIPQMVLEEKDSIPNPSDETPIEREIRLALQREETLRRERGIQHSVESKEIVEIQKNPVLSFSPEGQLSKKNKDKARTAFFLQREIQRDEQREADLKSEGKVPGLYDKGYAQEIDERRKLFEQPDEIPVQPLKLTTKTTSKGNMSGIQDTSTNQSDSRENTETTNLTVVDAPVPYSVRNNWKPKPLNPYRTRRLSVDNILDVRTPNDTSTAQETSEDLVRKENFQFQPLKFGLRLQEDKDKEEKDYKTEKKTESANGVEIYNTWLRPSRSSVIEEEIRQTLERDRELQERRGISELPSVSTSREDHYGYNEYGRPSVTSDGSRSWSSSSRKSTLSSPQPSNTATVQMFTPRIYPKIVFSESQPGSLKKQENWRPRRCTSARLSDVGKSHKMKKEDGFLHTGTKVDYRMAQDPIQERFGRIEESTEVKYAGIDPNDAVNTEIVESTRVSRHKSKMALRWEAGLFANEPSE